MLTRPVLAVFLAVLGGVAEAAEVSVPAGFRIDVFADHLRMPRALAVDPAGVVLVSVPAEGRVLALPDRRGTGHATEIVTVVKDLNLPHGLAFRSGYLYVAETGRILRFHYDPASFGASDPAVLVRGLPPGAHHWTRSLAFGPDGKLYVGVGSSCDICRELDRRRAAIVRYDADGAGEEVFATGLRNPAGLAFQPATGALWTSVNERDWPGGGAPPDYITLVRPGASYGWPESFARRGTVVPDPTFAARGPRHGMTLPTLELPPHSAPLGLAFYTGRQFPADYVGSLFLALHGSRAGLSPVGYKIVRIAFRDRQPEKVEDFSTGWRDGDQVLGRPVDVAVGHDGSLYVSDDHAGRVYRVTFGPR